MARWSECLLKKIGGRIGSRCGAWAVLVMLAGGGAARPFEVQVVDAATSRGIPLVVVETSLATRFVSDSAGRIALDDPLLMNRDVFVTPTSDGYRYNAPGLAMGGAVIHPREGSSITLVMERTMPAERLYRITGAGIYRDSVALGLPAPIAQAMINCNVTGQDSALCCPFDEKLFWIWGDTSRLDHPLKANFRATGATSKLPGKGGLDPAVGVNLGYLADGNFVRPMMPTRPGNGSQVYWLSCLMNVPDAAGKEHLLAWWNRIENPGMQTIERGIAEFNRESGHFEYLVDYPTTAPLQPGGHATRAGEYIIMTGDGAQTRVRASYEAASDPTQYEALTCLAGDESFSTATARVLRTADGKVHYTWRRGGRPCGAKEQAELVKAGLLQAGECQFRPLDAVTGKPFIPHACSIAWNPYRQRWTMILSEIMGTSMLGETWYLEAPAPEGPWTKGIKIVTHSEMTFYNPLQHPEFSVGGPYLYFEGTYTRTFSGAKVPTPYYDYNQVMYRLDLRDKRVKSLGEAPFEAVIDTTETP